MSDIEWRAAPDYEGVYEVSNRGDVRRVAGGMGARAGRILKAGYSARGVGAVTLYRENVPRRISVHRIVLRAFVGEPQPGQVACHADSNPRNNEVSNLRWDTQVSNIRDRDEAGHNHWSNRTHCPQGHLYDQSNTIVSKTATGICRHCRACKRARDGVRRATKRLANS